MAGSVKSQQVPGGVVHKLPADLRQALVGNEEALAAWRDITPLARNEFICWVLDAKREATRERRIRRTQEELERRVRELVTELDAAAVPVACSLDASGMQDRLARLRSIGVAALVEVEEPREGAALLRFRPDTETRSSLAEVVAAERACCPFLDLELADRDGLVELSIAAPPEGVGVLEELVSAFAARSS